MNNVLLLLFGALVVLAVLHYVYEAVAIPVLRLKLRHHLFAVRDRVRTAMTAATAPDDRAALEELHSSSNTIMRWLDVINMDLLNKTMRQYNRDAAFRKAVEARNALLSRAADPEVEAIRGQLAKSVVRAAIISGGAWAFYILPVIAVSDMVETIRAAVRQVVVLDERSLETLVTPPPVEA
ncbi:MAG: hypothetical protein J5I99_08910 [Verrucomicrobia bacterium]|nr:hypothetical protein [Verrucomicrobiota bacterium]